MIVENETENQNEHEMDPGEYGISRDQGLIVVRTYLQMSQLPKYTDPKAFNIYISLTLSLSLSLSLSLLHCKYKYKWVIHTKQGPARNPSIPLLLAQSRV